MPWRTSHHQKFKQPTHCARKSRIRQTREGARKLGSGMAVAAAQRVAAVHSATTAERLQQRGCCGGRSAAVVRSATVGGCIFSGATKARRWRTARRRQRGGSSAEAAADSPAPSANGPTQVLSNATDSLTYASSSLVEDRGTTASTASSLLPLRSPMRRRCRG